jgi:hypothetical protein
MKKKCPKCSVVFECNSQFIEDCQCYVVNLSKQELNNIEAQYDDCLCAACMNEIKNTKNDINRKNETIGNTNF